MSAPDIATPAPNGQDNSPQDEDLEEDVCRYCRMPATPTQPLFHPCQCSGSLKYVHESCLRTWQATSHSTKCEVCKYTIKFETVWHMNTPDRLPISEIVQGLIKNINNAISTFVHRSLVVLMWLVLLPLGVSYMYNAAFSDPGLDGLSVTRSPVRSSTPSQLQSSNSQSHQTGSHTTQIGGFYSILLPLTYTKALAKLTQFHTIFYKIITLDITFTDWYSGIFVCFVNVAVIVFMLMLREQMINVMERNVREQRQIVINEMRDMYKNMYKKQRLVQVQKALIAESLKESLRKVENEIEESQKALTEASTSKQITEPSFDAQDDQFSSADDTLSTSNMRLRSSERLQDKNKQVETQPINNNNINSRINLNNLNNDHEFSDQSSNYDADDTNWSSEINEEENSHSSESSTSSNTDYSYSEGTAVSDEVPNELISENKTEQVSSSSKKSSERLTEEELAKIEELFEASRSKSRSRGRSAAPAEQNIERGPEIPAAADERENDLQPPQGIPQRDQENEVDLDNDNNPALEQLLPNQQPEAPQPPNIQIEQDNDDDNLGFGRGPGIQIDLNNVTWQRLIGLDGSYNFIEHVFYAFLLNGVILWFFWYFPMWLGKAGLVRMPVLNGVFGMTPKILRSGVFLLKNFLCKFDLCKCDLCQTNDLCK